MTVYIFMIVAWLAGYYAMVYQSGNSVASVKAKEKKSKLYVVFAGSVLFLVMGLRHKYVGIDTTQYLERYHVSDRYDWSFFLNAQQWIKQELAFTLIGKVLQTFDVGNQMYLVLYALFISLCISRLIYKYMKNLFWGFYLHTTIGLFTMSMSGMRQSIACCICWLGIDYIIDKKPIRFCLLVLIASTFHQSAIFFLVFYWIGNVKIKKASGWLAWLFCLAFVFLRPVFVVILTKLMPVKYSIYGMVSDKNPINPLLVAIALLIPMFCLFFWERSKLETEQQERLYSLCFLGSFIYAMITIMSLSSNMIGRMSQYFYIFNVVLLGNVITDIDDYKTRYIVMLFAILLPGYMFFKSQSLGIAPYYFFWQVYGS